MFVLNVVKWTSENAVWKLSEKGSEQGSEHGFGLYSGAKTGRKIPFGCLMRPRPGHLRDFSDSFWAKFAELPFHAVGCIEPVQHGKDAAAQGRLQTFCASTIP